MDQGGGDDDDNDVPLTMDQVDAYAFVFAYEFLFAFGLSGLTMLMHFYLLSRIWLFVFWIFPFLWAI